MDAAVDVELDHVIVFLPGPAAADPYRFPGGVPDPGRRHTGQGTRNRRVLYARSYVELLWVDDGAEHDRTGLGFAPRCARPPRACPVGVVLRGPVPDEERERYVGYTVPAGGPRLLLLRAALERPDLPFVAVFETAGVAPPPRPADAEDVVTATLRSPAVPDLGALRPRDVVFEAGDPQLRLAVDGLAEPVTVGPLQ